MTLLLGPPSSGNTTLLKALTGKLEEDLRTLDNRKNHLLWACGLELRKFIPQRTCAYISQHDLHHGEMTIRETLDFSGRCFGVGARYELLAELSRREKGAGIKTDPEIDAFMKAIAIAGQKTSVIIGLDICADTMVGDEMRRGISGGQKKRVTTGEMLISPANVFYMDEISTEGQIVYQGPHEQVLDFFGSVGFKCPERKGVADFLQEKLSSELRGPCDKSEAHPAALVKEKYGISNKDHFKACLAMEWLLMKRNSFVYIFKTTQITIIALFTFTVFFGTQMKRGEIDDGGIWIILTYYTVGFAPAASRWPWVSSVSLQPLEEHKLLQILKNLPRCWFLSLVDLSLPKTKCNRSSGVSSPKMVHKGESKKNKLPFSNGKVATERSSASTGNNTPEQENVDSSVSATNKRGMVLPFMPLSLSFNHVNYYVHMPAEMKRQGVEETRLQLL
ncbi:unnamed protein product [Fraxinus pennsylvanica]|uniref:ABC transporter domain-containing protein n=1 Tax=Fraxinus pennsylvanica TaxID=56036 RepID=A0AAD1ZNF3_9LAMI|nr:unnamed protein product [Fraxinus pennsylvanica]